MNMRLKRRVLLCSFLVFIISACQGKGAVPDISLEETPSEHIERKGESTDNMTAEEVWRYMRKYDYYDNDNYRSSIWGTYEKTMKYYFPNREWWFTDIIEKRENDYVAQISDFDRLQKKESFEAQVLIKPDFSIEILEDTIKVNPKDEFCIYASGTDYIYHGCRMAEYHVEFHNQERDLFLESEVPLFSLKESEDWDEINQNIWEGMKNWFDAEVHYEKGRISLGYEIKTLDNDIYSVLFYGTYTNDEIQENIAMGMTVSMSSGQVLSHNIFSKDEEQKSLYDFYIEDNVLYFIKNERGGYKVIEDRNVDFLSYNIEKKERNLYSHNGIWLADIYYDLPEISGYTEEIKAVNAQMRKDMGRFFNELAMESGEIVSILYKETEYGSEEDYATVMGGPACHCYVDTEIICNNENEFGVVYRYTVFMALMFEEGEAVAIYDLKEGNIIEYQDWQKEILEKVSACRQKYSRLIND